MFACEDNYNADDTERAVRLCADLAKTESSLSKSETEEKLTNIESYTNELQVAFDVCV